VPRVITFEDCFMATNRSRRLRKKLCVDEFQELGFELTLNFKADLSDQTLDDFVDQFLDQAIAGNGLDYVGGEDFGLVCLAKRGSVNEEAVTNWKSSSSARCRTSGTRKTRSTRLDRYSAPGSLAPVIR
jgi:uncharacterized protein YggL (DUF469 family)